MKLCIRGGRLIDPANNIDTITDIHINDGKIIHIGESNNTAEQVIDARGLIVCPGIVDLSVSLPEPGKQQKGSISTETRAAAAGGITSICCLPDSIPVIDSASVATLGTKI